MNIGFSEMTEEFRLRRLELPIDRVRMILDTDPGEDPDDSFAIVYPLLSPEKLDWEVDCQPSSNP